jgi:hypothetical protein
VLDKLEAECRLIIERVVSRVVVTTAPNVAGAAEVVEVYAPVATPVIVDDDTSVE